MVSLTPETVKLVFLASANYFMQDIWQIIYHALDIKNAAI